MESETSSKKRDKEDSSSNFILWNTPRTLQQHTPLTDRTHYPNPNPTPKTSNNMHTTTAPHPAHNATKP